MPPNPFTEYGEERNNNVLVPNKLTDGSVTEKQPYKMEIVWRNIFIFIVLHYAAIAFLFTDVKRTTIIIGFIFGIAGSFGISSGAHRLWAHKAYKANMKMKVMLLFFQTISLQNSVIEWVRDHRVHHKFSDTSADPHDSNRGFFFSHMGWLLCRKHPDVKKYGAKIDMSDLTSDPLLIWQHKYYVWLILPVSFGLPVFISWYFFGEDPKVALYGNLFRYVLTLHITWTTNSFSHHLGGTKPFEKNMRPRDSYIIGFLAFGEGWHNYHHVYPWDYKVSELPRYWCNFSIGFIDFFAWLGWAYDLKTVSDEVIRKRVLRTGDGTHRYARKEITQKKETERDVAHFWGWGDDDMQEEDVKGIKILHKKEND